MVSPRSDARWKAVHQRGIERHGVVEQGAVEIADEEIVRRGRHARRSPRWNRAAHSRLQKKSGAPPASDRMARDIRT